MKAIILYNLVYCWKIKPYAYNVYANKTLKEIKEFLDINKYQISWYRTYPNSKRFI